MTTRADEMGRFTQFNYDMNYTEARLTSFQAADGVTFSITISTNGEINEISSSAINKSTTFGRTDGQLTSIIDAVGISSSWEVVNDSGSVPVIKKITTPYGVTYVDTSSEGYSGVQRRLVFLHPDLTSDTYALVNLISAMNTNFASSQVPTNTPFAKLDITGRNERNILHWGRQVSVNSLGDFVRSVNLIKTKTPNLNDLTVNEINRAHVKHWLATSQYNYTHFDTLSWQQYPSPVEDGSVEGPVVWYDYAGKTITYERPLNGQVQPSVIARVNADGSTWVKSFTRNPQGKPLVQTESWMEQNGGAWVQKLRIRKNTYSSDGIDLLEERDGSNQLIRKYTWDTNHRLKSLKEYHQYTIDPNLGFYETTYEYDAFGRTVSETTPAGLTTSWVYTSPPLNHAIGYSVVITNTPVGGTETQFWQYGQLRSITDVRGLTKVFDWDGLNRLARTSYPDGTYTETQYTRSDGKKILDPVSQRDRMGNVRIFEYDSMRRKNKITDERNKTTTLDYCNCGSLATITGPNSNVVYHEYDKVGRRAKTQWKNPDGEVTAERVYDYDIWGQPKTAVDGSTNGASLRFTHDNRGLPTIIEAQTGTDTNSAWARLRSTIYDIDGRPSTIIDRNGVKITQTFDQLGRVLTRTQPAHEASGITATDRFGYTARGKTSWTNTDNRVWTYAYDELRRKTSQTQPDTDGNLSNDTTSYVYNNASDLLRLTDPRGKVTAWSYDGYGRMTNKTYASDGFANLTYGYDANDRLKWRRFYSTPTSFKQTSYDYDEAGNLKYIDYPSSFDITYTYDDAGRLQSMDDATGKTTYSYTEWNTIRSEDGPWSGTSDRLTYNYSTGRQLTGVTVEQPNGTMTISYSPDLAGRIGRVVSLAGVFSNKFLAPTIADSATGGLPTYASSLADVTSLPNSGIIDLDYDLRGRLTVSELKTGGGHSLNKHSYIYNNNNLRSRQTRGNTGWTDYVYDAIGQLDTALAMLPSSTVDMAERLDYGYDAGWNLISRQDNGVSSTNSVNDRNHIIGDPIFTYAYDSNGNRTARTSQTATATGTATSSAPMISMGSPTAPVRNNFTGWVGAVIRIGSAPVIVSELGRWKLSGSSGTHIVKIVQENQADLPGATTSVNLAGGSVGTFVYSALPASVVLEPNKIYYLVSSETEGMDSWYDWNQAVTSSGGLSVVSTVWSYPGGPFSLYGHGSTGFGPVGLKGGTGTQGGQSTMASSIQYGFDDENQLLSVTNGTQSMTTFVYDGKRRRRIAKEYSWAVGAGNGGTTAALITCGSPSASIRNNFTGWVGTVIQVGSSPVTISELGRWKLAGGYRTHTVKIVREDQTDLPGATVLVNLAGGSDNTFVYSALPAAVVLEANKTYYLVSEETENGDTWYDLTQNVTVSGGLSAISTVWRYPGANYTRYGGGGLSFGPVGLKGTSSGGSYGQWVLASETRYVYDGMRVIQERTSNGVPTVAYTRGPDLSGTLEGAGGIGGLLARSEWNSVSSTWSHAFYHSDGVGNVTALAVPNGNDIALAGSYRYDPFGRLIGTPTGLAARNTQRFSSKDWHNPSGFYYFGYRFYDPATQRWLNRDPMGEEGGLNLYGYVGNNPIDLIDPFGLAEGDYKSTAINNALQSVGSTSTYGDLQPVKGTPYKFDPNTQKYLRFDLDASHKDPNIHFFDSLKDMKKNKTSCKVFVNAKTAAVKSLSFLGIGITMVGNLNAVADNPNYREALAAAKAGDKAGAENALYELSVDLSIESGSTAPLYIINSQIK
jgi:RHS repeat-associated protein